MDISNFYEDLKGRLKSPLYGTYTVSVILINWKVILFLFGDYSTSNKINAISAEIDNWLHFFMLPLLVTILFFFGFRLLENKALKYVNWLKRKRKEDMLKSAGQEFYSGAEFLNKVRELEETNKTALKLRNELTTQETALLKITGENIVLNRNSESQRDWLNENSGYNSVKNLQGTWRYSYGEKLNGEFIK